MSRRGGSLPTIQTARESLEDRAAKLWAVVEQADPRFGHQAGDVVAVVAAFQVAADLGGGPGRLDRVEVSMRADPDRGDVVGVRLAHRDAAV